LAFGRNNTINYFENIKITYKSYMVMLTLFVFVQIIKSNIFLFQTWPFQNPVNKKVIKDYYDVIEQPMDLNTILKVLKKKSHRFMVHFRDFLFLKYFRMIQR
jgi:transcription initiation factor TFIID subunit 1